ncbi:N-acetylglutamate synthase, GNAT family [Chryseolinea serpens]|uniref:N-acetylglutamate synthase, GNAT family n=1 Tax=Chryseolinea serpens TaxID=947013 RepID=A0A1M5KXM6_9BACT|nr:GNAT family N-acetyltransferase [Chryseolinea serpens]SHG57475.1 N-acetylglutamate synthase, GNAT family [Chryseolinea serpens]
MEIRPATDADIPAIVTLLKQSLGESLMPKSDRYWRWKHVENPFGPSPVLLCLENGELIGVRAFMRWEWYRQGQRFKAVRAVDTATHPDHQGKGIFKNLTLSLVKSCTQEGDDFVFNTPNQQSKPGYLKMGWMEAGRLPVRLGIRRPFHMLKNIVAGNGAGLPDETSDLANHLNHPQLAELCQDHLAQMNDTTTHISPHYLRWRYQDVPVAAYVAAAEEKNGKLTGLLVGRIKVSRLGRELRVTDCFLRGDNAGKDLMKQLRTHKKKWNYDYITVAGTLSPAATRLFAPGTVKLSKGPIVTVRPLALTNLGALMNFNQWSPSLGDLELF